MRFSPASTVVLTVALLLGGCGYQAGSFAFHGKPFPGPRATLGCLDVAIAANSDDVAAGAIARFSMANRCDHAARVDLTRVVAREKSSAGEQRTIAATDPRGELRPVLLEARSVAIEYLEYPIREGSSLCLELGGMTDRQPGESVEVCLRLRTAEASR